jgi:hypothetical protein
VNFSKELGEQDGQMSGNCSLSFQRERMREPCFPHPLQTAIENRPRFIVNQKIASLASSS